MFAVIQIEKGQGEGIFARLLHRMKKRAILVQPVQTALGSYMLVTLRSERVNWDKVAAALGRAARFAVMPRTLELPEGCPVRRFEPESFLSHLLLNTCIDTIRQTKLPLYRKIVTLVDSNGRYADYVPELLCHCITVVVVTAAQERYSAVSERMMEELGAGIVVTDSADGCAGSMLVIAPETEDAVKVTQPVVVITAGDIDQPAPCRMVGDLRLSARGELAGCVPRGIDPLDFGAAMYLHSGWKGGGKLKADTLRCKNNVLSTAEIARYIERSAAKNANIISN